MRMVIGHRSISLGALECLGEPFIGAFFAGHTEFLGKKRQEVNEYALGRIFCFAVRRYKTSFRGLFLNRNRVCIFCRTQFALCECRDAFLVHNHALFDGFSHLDESKSILGR